MKERTATRAEAWLRTASRTDAQDRQYALLRAWLERRRQKAAPRPDAEPEPTTENGEPTAKGRRGG